MRHFLYKNLEQLQQAADQITQHVRFEADKTIVQAALGRTVIGKSYKLGNSMAIHPMEGCDSTADGSPSDLTWRRYERFAQGGAKLVWFEATAVREDGRANPRQLWIRQDNVGEYARILEMIRREHKARFGATDDLLEPMQLTHSGRYSVPKKTIAYHNPLIDQKSGVPADYPIITDHELERLEDAYVEGAKLAVQAGFRAIELKVTHGYLFSELLGAKTREGHYGGSLENRTRAIKNVFGKIRAAVGNQLIFCMRLGCFDSVPYAVGPDGTGVPLPYTTPYPWGWGVNPNNPLEEDLTEVKQAIGWFKDWGVELLNVSLGCPYYNPHIVRPFEKPDEGNYEQPEQPLNGVDRHYRISGELQRAFPDLPMVGSGYSWLQIYSINAAAHNVAHGNIRIFGIGRNALAYPDFATDVTEKGELDERRVCKTLTYCTFLMRNKNNAIGQFPTGCPPFDKMVYGPIMKEAREAFRIAAKK